MVFNIKFSIIVTCELESVFHCVVTHSFLFPCVLTIKETCWVPVGKQCIVMSLGVRTGGVC